MGPEADLARQCNSRAEQPAGSAGDDPCPYLTDSTAAALAGDHAGLGPDVHTEVRVRLAGHLDRIRRHGRLAFAVLHDSTGTIQLLVDQSVLGAEQYAEFDALLPGDRIGVEGVVLTTRRGELSVGVQSLALLDPGHGVRPDSTATDSASGLVPPAPAAVEAVGASVSTTPGPGTAEQNPTQDPFAGSGWVPPPPPATSSDRYKGAVRVIAALAALSGMLQLLGQVPSVQHRVGAREAELVTPSVPLTGHVAAVLIGLWLILLADQLGKRKRVAWRVAVGLLAIAMLIHVFPHPQPVAAVLAGGMLALLIRYRSVFQAPHDPPSLLRLLRFLPVYLAAVLLFGLGGLWVEHNRLDPPLSIGGVLQTVFRGLVGTEGPYTYRSRLFAALFPTALLALGVVGLITLAILMFRPLVARRSHTSADWEHASRLVHTYGWDTLAYFTFRNDKSFLFSSDGEAFLAYTYLGGYALVSGDPIGAPPSVVRVLDEFLAMCDARAWTPALLAVRATSMPLYASRGFAAFYLGDEAIIDCRRFGLEGRARKSLRAAVRRIGRTHRFRLMPESHASPELVSQLNAISARWRGKKPERGFTMALSQDVRGAGENPEFLLCIALDTDGVPGGFLRLVPAYSSSFGYTLDLMRHDPDAPNGMTEFLVASTARALAARGVTRLSLNFAMWGRLFAEDVPFTTAQRLARSALGLLSPFYQIQSLRDFNAKFDPDWLPRVLAYRRATDLPKVGLRYLAAEGFLALPGLGDLLVPKAVGGPQRRDEPRTQPPVVSRAAPGPTGAPPPA